MLPESDEIQSSASKRELLCQQWQLCLLAISFFTRIPVNMAVDVTAKMLNEASRYFALVGVLIGIISALAFYLSAMYLPTEIALLVAMASSVLLTGAFHEDGWADVWDGFGGGWSIENKLNIMKDSRLGTYGAAALFFILMIKYQTLLALIQQNMSNVNLINDGLSVLSILVLGHCLSRVLATSLIADMPYVSEDATSKVKPLAQALSNNSYLTLLATGTLILLITLSFSVTWTLVVILLLTRWCLKRWFMQQLGGYTGDCLGAAQQFSEVVIYIITCPYIGEHMTEIVKHKIQLILGGARSGKSSLAEQYAMLSKLPVTYIATAQALDAEMAQRIAQHQAERPTHWRLIEAPLQLSVTIESIISEALSSNSSGVCILVDCLTLWLSNSLCQSNSSTDSSNNVSQDSCNSEYWQQEKQQFLKLLNSLQDVNFARENTQTFAIELILVSNEVGHGIVPMGELSRQFVDQAGWLHQAIAKVADKVEFVMAGLPLTLKSVENISHKAPL